MDIWFIFQNFFMYASSDESSSFPDAMDMFQAGKKVPRKGTVISIKDPYRKPTQVGESSRLR